MSDLHLHVKTEYFEAIKRGEKIEEYRRCNNYWKEKLLDEHSLSYVRVFDNVIIHNAYKSGEENRLTFPWNGWEIKTITHKHFGPEPVTVFAIKLEK